MYSARKTNQRTMWSKAFAGENHVTISAAEFVPSLYKEHSRNTTLDKLFHTFYFLPDFKIFTIFVAYQWQAQFCSYNSMRWGYFIGSCLCSSSKILWNEKLEIFLLQVYLDRMRAMFTLLFNQTLLPCIWVSLS